MNNIGSIYRTQKGWDIASST